MYKAYVRLDATQKLLATQSKWLFHNFEDSQERAPSKPSAKQRLPQLFPASGPLNISVMDILESLPRTLSGTQIALVVKDCFKKVNESPPDV